MYSGRSRGPSASLASFRFARDSPSPASALISFFYFLSLITKLLLRSSVCLDFHRCLCVYILDPLPYYVLLDHVVTFPVSTVLCVH